MVARVSNGAGVGGVGGVALARTSSTCATSFTTFDRVSDICVLSSFLCCPMHSTQFGRLCPRTISCSSCTPDRHACMQACMQAGMYAGMHAGSRVSHGTEGGIAGARAHLLQILDTHFPVLVD